MTANLDTRLTPDAVREFGAEAKIGILGTVSAEGLPHLSLITTLQARTPQQLTFGQFTQGLSKAQLRDNPHAGFLVMNARRQLWRGRARWTHEVSDGDEYEAYNRLPMFRYNSYFGIHTVHYLDLVTTTPCETLSLPRIVAGSLLAAATKVAVRPDHAKGTDPALTPWAQSHINQLGTLKFVGYVGGDGFPVIVPVVPCQAADARTLVLSPFTYHRELAAIPDGAPVAVFAVNMEMQSVLTRGTLRGYRRPLGPRLGIIDLDWVYNTMPPQPGPIYPRPPLEPVTDFD